jgi:hypothetical protein
VKLSSRQILLYPIAALSLLGSAAACYVSWAWQQESRQELHRLNRQASAAAQQSISRSAEQERQLKLLGETSEHAGLDEFDPPRWLSAIKGVSLAAVDPASVRARVLTDSLVVLDSHAELSVVAVPIEFELQVSHRAAGVLAIARYGISLGAYSSIENCQLQAVQQKSIDQGFRLRCRVLKYATRASSADA